MYILPQNRHTPCYINITITRYNKLLGHQHKQAQKKERDKKKNNAKTSGSKKMKMTATAETLHKIPTTLLEL
jgi:hypothetical protein